MAFEENLVEKYDIDDIEHPPSLKETQIIIDFIEDWIEEVSDYLGVEKEKVGSWTIEEIDRKVMAKMEKEKMFKDFAENDRNVSDVIAENRGKGDDESGNV